MELDADRRPTASRPRVRSLPAAGDLAARAAAVRGVGELADATVAWLEERGVPLPSIYLERAKRLRCVAVRGYWQILDGFTMERGVLAETFRTGTAQLVPDVRLQPDYIGAVPGVLAELCLPLRYEGRVVGGLNAELQRVLRDEDVALVRQAADVFEQRLAELGGPEPESPWQLLARRAAELAALTDPAEIAAYSVNAAAEVTGFASALLVVERGGVHQVEAACGPLEAALRDLPVEALPAIATWTSSATTAYTLGQIAGSGFPGHQELRERGVSALISATLPSRGKRHGFLLAAGTEPVGFAPDAAQHMEILAAQAASTLHTASALAAIRERASQDPLTGLGHSATFHDDLAAAVTRAEERVAVLLIDLDHFKQINDTRGHLVGDEVLVAGASLMAARLRPTDRLYRLGGDEFAAIVGVRDLEDARGVADRIATTMREEADTTVSIGVTMVDATKNEGSDAVLARADLALYETKRGGRDGVTAYRPELRAAVLDRARLAADLAAAIERRELTLAYQPVMDLHGAGVLGVEALVRWDHPRRGPVPPATFIPLAEEDGLIGGIGRFVLDEACRQLAEWDAAGWARHDLKLGVNVSADELGPELVAEVRETLLRHGVAPDRLVIEVTESVFIDAQRASEPLRRLRELGVAVAVDDFGTGYSSLSYLQRLPVDILKIDRSFITDLDATRNRGVVQAILQLSTTLGMSTVAEGIERVEQADQLRAMGCEHAQGYLWSRPVTAKELPEVSRRLSPA
jgi:diguanylate cyclase (GGDEF)-like protein